MPGSSNTASKPDHHRRPKVEDKTISNDEVILNLKIIAEIKKHDKLVTSSKILEIDRNTYLQPVRRYFGGYSRRATVNRISMVINRAFAITDKILAEETGNKTNKTTAYFSEKNSHILQSFKHNLENACRGIQNLRDTYSDDVTTRASLELLVSKMETRVNKITRLFSIATEN